MSGALIQRVRLSHAALILLVASAVAGIAGAHANASEAQTGPPVSCQELRDLGLTVSYTDASLTGGDETHFCVIARPEEDTYIALIPNVSTPDEFRSAKSTYAKAIMDAGQEICRISAWRPLNREGGPQILLSAADQLDQLGSCQPRVVARDTGAVLWIAPVQVALAAIVERTTAEFGVAPRRPLTVDLYADPAAFATAIRAGARLASQSMEPEAAARIARGGRSLTVLTATRGAYMLLNLTQNPDPTTLTRRLAHEYTHFAQSAIGGTLDAYPMWFLEGHAEFQMERLAGRDIDHRLDAARRDRAGTAPRLRDLVTPEQWTASEARLGSDAVYSRAYSAVAYIAERWGYPATLQLLRAGSDVDPAQFDQVFGATTGLDLDGLDQAVTGWLRSLGGQVTFYNDSPLAHRLLLADGRTVDVPACRTCAFLRAAESCREDGRPSARLDLPAGDVELNLIVPDDRVHFPDRTLRLTVEPGGAHVRCLALRVG